MKTLTKTLSILFVFAVIFGANTTTMKSVEKPYDMNTADLSYDQVRAAYVLTVGGGEYDYEITWDISLDGTALFSGAAGAFDIDLEDGTYIFNGFDSWGDGWNGGTATLADADGAVQFSLGFDAGSEFSAEFTVPSADVFGCTDPLALNYNPEATIDDGSCEYPCLDTEITRSIIVGSYGSEVSWDVVDALGVQVDAGVGADVDPTILCLADGIYTVNMHDSYGDGWNGYAINFTDPDGNLIGSGTLETGAEGSFDFTVGGEVPVYGCTDSEAINYNPDATVDDGSCLYEGDTCETALDGGVINGGEIVDATTVAYDVDWYSFVLDADYDFVTVSLCGSAFDTKLEVWGACDDTEYLGYNDDAPCDGRSLQSQVDLTNLVAGTYYAKVYGYGTAFGDYVLNITGESAPTAPILTATAGPEEVALTWEPVPTAPVVRATDLAHFDKTAEIKKAAYEARRGIPNTVDLTITQMRAAYVLTVGGGEYDYEISWNITDLDAAVLYEGDAGVFDIDLEDGTYIFNGFDSWGDGWNGGEAILVDVDEAVQFTTTGPEGIYPDATDISFEFTVPNAEVYGCMDETALNYNPDATVDDGSCSYIGDTCEDPIIAIEGINSATGATQWFEFTPVEDQMVTVSSDGTAEDTYLNVYSDCDFTFVASNDDIDYGGGNYASEVTFTAYAGVAYKIFWNAYYGPGPFDFVVSTSEWIAPPANDECVDAQFVGVDEQGIAIDGTTLGATEDCIDEGWNGVWYEIELPYTFNNLTISLTSTELLDNAAILLEEDCTCDLPIYSSGYVWPGGGVDYTYSVWFDELVGGTVLFPAMVEPAADFQITFTVEEAYVPSFDVYKEAESGVFTAIAEGIYDLAYTDYDVEAGVEECYYVVQDLEDGSLSDVSETECAIPLDVVFGNPPRSLTAVGGGGVIDLAWAAPVNPATVFEGYDDGENYTSVGTGGSSFYACIKWAAGDLAAYDGQYITDVSFFLGADAELAGTEIEAVVFVDGALVASQPCEIVANDWNIIGLPEVVLINSASEITVGIHSNGGGFNAGADAGPAVAPGYSDLVSYDGAEWISMANEYGLNYNWNCKAGITDYAVRSVATKTIFVEKDYLGKNTDVVMQGAVNEAGHKFVHNTNAMRDFLYYNVNRDGALVGTTTELVYQDLVEDQIEFCYTVSAEYTEGTSAVTTEACAIAGIYGCTDSGALNYDPDATIDDGSCYYFGDVCEYPFDAVFGLNEGTVGGHWFSFTPDVDGIYYVSSLDNGACVDTQVEIWDACDAEDYIAFGDDEGGTPCWESYTEWTAVAGHTYKIHWTGFWNGVDPFNWTLGFLANPEMTLSATELIQTGAGDQVLTIGNIGDADLEFTATFDYEVMDMDVVFTENFDGGVLPEGWTESTNATTGWFITEDGSSSYWSIPPGDGFYACDNDDMNGSGSDGSVDYLVTPLIDLTGYPVASLTFDSFFTAAYSQIATVEVSTDGVTWEVASTLEGGTVWTNVEVDLSAYANQAIYVAFHADDAGAWASGWAVDNVVVSVITETYNWLSIDPTSGTVVPEATLDVTVAFDDVGLAEGTYLANISIATNDVDAVLPVTFVVEAGGCDSDPGWEVNPAAFEFNATLTLALYFDDVISLEECDVLAAFVGDEIRGVASPTYFDFGDSWTVNMMVYANADGDIITFQAFNYETGEVWDNVDYVYSFVANDIVGDDFNPVEVHALSTITQTIPFAAGWNWFSVNVEADDMGLDSVLGSLGENGSLIKNQSGYATYYADFGWYGLDVFDVTSMYMIQMTADADLSFEGYPVDFLNTPIALAAGWSWIGYLPQASNTLDIALESIGENGGLIKSQTSYATYYTGFGWYGMDALNPGEGYMIQMIADAELVYGIPAGMARTTEVSELNWTVDYRSFEHNMTITAQLNEGDQLAAFVGDECRGVVESTHFPLTDTYTANLMAYGEAGEELSFRVYKSGVEVSLSETIEFVVNGIVGNDIEPVLFKEDMKPTAFGLSQNYPNPFNPVTMIGYDIPNDSFVSISVYNIMGQKVADLVSSEVLAGYHQVQWDGTNLNGEPVASGVYVYTINADGFTSVKKMLLMK